MNNLFDTKVIEIDENSINDDELSPVIKALKAGEIVAIPTETVYGLGANIYDESAIKKIYAAKGRPSDNPLIAHISSYEELDLLVENFPEDAKALCAAFWPGPLSIVLKKSDIVPSIVSGGLDTVAVRMPSHPVFLRIIELAGFPIVAPSANISGLPSATTAADVYDDLAGKIPYIVSAGDSEIGLESTVISFTRENPVLLRPGGLPLSDIKKILKNTIVHPSVMAGFFEKSSTPAAPGMKYRHYSPKARLKLFIGKSADFADLINSSGAFALCFDEDIPLLKNGYLSYGNGANPADLQKKLFSALRKLDKLGVEAAVVHCPEESDDFLPVYNRLLKSANYEVI